MVPRAPLFYPDNQTARPRDVTRPGPLRVSTSFPLLPTRGSMLTGTVKVTFVLGPFTSFPLTQRV